eukprot:scaffold5992_cov158-Ochromonas_danica.AAC.5
MRSADVPAKLIDLKVFLGHEVSQGGHLGLELSHEEALLDFPPHALRRAAPHPLREVQQLLNAALLASCLSLEALVLSFESVDGLLAACQAALDFLQFHREVFAGRMVRDISSRTRFAARALSRYFLCPCASPLGLSRRWSSRRSVRQRSRKRRLSLGGLSDCQ